ncbi:MAG: signal peptidase II [Solobacterium sp.]|nr:signal peptidase II [Solobacterium sp.]
MRYILMIAVLVIDQLSKYLIAASPMQYAHMELIPGFFYLTYAKNTGVAWSMFSGGQATAALCIVAAVAFIGLSYLMERAHKSGNKLQTVVFALMASGALGNLIDRLMLGYVRDFLDFIIFGYDFPIFNIADSALCIGVGLMIIEMILEERKEKADGKTQI